jgi:oxygen-independent coproporphyrinogen-3 oxidase
LSYPQFYDDAYHYLRDHGYHAPYGALSFSQRADETGTSPYFEGRLLDGLPYLGLGNYASSLMGEEWWFAPDHVRQWIAAVEQGDPFPVQHLYHLPDEERMAKYVLLSLSFGLIDQGRFRRIFARELQEVFATPLNLLLSQGLMYAEGPFYKITPGQFGRLAEIRSLFYSRSALKWVQETYPLRPAP